MKANKEPVQLSSWYQKSIPKGLKKFTENGKDKKNLNKTKAKKWMKSETREQESEREKIP